MIQIAETIRRTSVWPSFDYKRYIKSFCEHWTSSHWDRFRATWRRYRSNEVIFVPSSSSRSRCTRDRLNEFEGRKTRYPTIDGIMLCSIRATPHAIVGRPIARPEQETRTSWLTKTRYGGGNSSTGDPLLCALTQQPLCIHRKAARATGGG